jgi:nitroreductase
VSDAEATRDRIAFLRGLRSVRRFRPDPIPSEVVDDLLEVARWTGSARNLQPWELVVIQDHKTLGALAELEGYARHLAGAPLGIVLVMAGQEHEQEAYDDGRLSERIMLAAAAHGVASCIGWWAGDGRSAAKELLGVPPERTVRTALSLGYAAEDTRRASSRPGAGRKPLSDIVHEERYRS